MSWRLVLASCLATRIQAFVPAPIRWHGQAGGSFVLTPKVLPTRASVGLGFHAPQMLTITERSGKTSSADIPLFATRPDQTIAWVVQGQPQGLCIEANGENIGDKIRVNYCTGGRNQLWDSLSRGPGREKQMQLKSTTKCLTVNGATGGLREPSIELRECDDEVSQSWIFEDPTPFATQGPSQRHLPSSLVRHAMVSVLAMVFLGALSLSVWLYHKRMPHVAALTHGGRPLNLDGGVICLSDKVAMFHDRSALTHSSKSSHWHRVSGVSMTTTIEPEVAKKKKGMSKTREERRDIMKSPNFNRAGFPKEKAAVQGVMTKEFNSPLIKQMRDSGGTLVRGDVTVKLAEYFGFCRGVERAIAMAYQARAAFPDKDLHITNEIIHNPGVNKGLAEMGVSIIEPAATPGGKKDFGQVKDGDVVILPAFGASIDEMRQLNEMNVQVVDGTCPWVSKVWNVADKHIVAGKTTIIHGKWAHEETVATASMCEDYLIVKDEAEAQYVIDYILKGENKQEFLEKFKNAMSKDFDPDTHLTKIGLANQTTMYKKETKQIGRMFERAMLEKFGPVNLGDRYAEFDTICDATQERQDAVTDLVSNDEKMDFVLVVGGFNSSNTAHLKEIPEKYGVPAYHIDAANRIGPDNTLEHREMDGSVVKLENFFKKGPVTFGITSGASTPDSAMEDALERIFMLKAMM